MKRKVISILLLSLCVFCLIFSINTLTVNADEICVLCGNPHNVAGMSWPNSWVYDMQCKIYGGDIMGDDTLEVVQFNVQGNKFSTLWDKGAELYEGFAILGELLCAVYVFYDLLTKAISDNINAEHVFKGFMKLAIGMLIIKNGYVMIGAAAEFATNVFNQIMSNGEGGAAMADMCEFGTLNSKNFFQALVDASTLFIPWLLMLVAGAILAVTCWIRVLDIMVRVIFAPIGMADIMNDGTRSSGWAYFKRLLGSLLQGSVLIVTIKSYGIIMPVVQRMSGLASWAMPIILAFVLISLFFKASAMAADVVG